MLADMKTTKNKTTDAEMTCAMMKALQERYSRPEWCFMTEVPDGTGAKASRRADAVAYNLFPSKGNVMICFEIKASKTDLKRELSDGLKSNAIGQYADYFFLVCPDGIIDDSMLLPKTWGILTFKNGKLKQTKKPEILKSAPMTKNFVAALLQSMLRANDAEVADMEHHIGNLVTQKLQEQLQYYTRQKEQEWQRENKRMKDQLDLVSAWKDAMEKCYHSDFFEFLREKGNSSWRSKTLEEIIQDDNIVKDLADFISLRKDLVDNSEYTLNTLKSRVQGLEKVINGMHQLFLHPASYMDSNKRYASLTKEETEQFLGIPLFDGDMVS